MTTNVVDLVEQQTTALDLADRGLAVFPVDHPSLPECVGRHIRGRTCDGGRGKHPVPRSWPAASTRDPRLVAAAFSGGPRNIGVDAGKSGLLVLDEDAHGEMARLCGDHTADPPDTLTVTTGKGAHWYFQQPAEALGNGKAGIRTYNIDVRGAGGYVVGPGSLHQTGRRYEIHNPAPVAPLPGWLLALLRPVHDPAQRRAPGPVTIRGVGALLQVVLDAAAGERNNRLFWTACRIYERVRDGQLADSQAEAMLVDTANAVHLPPVEALATIRSARRNVIGG